AGEEPELHPLQMREEPHAQVAHDAIAHARREQGLHYPEQRREHEDDDHRDDEPGEDRDVRRSALRRAGPSVEAALRDERREDPQTRRHQHECDDDDKLPPVRSEELGDAGAEALDLRGLAVDPALLLAVAGRYAAAAVPAVPHAHDWKTSP